MDGTGAAEAAGGPLGRSPALSKNYSDNGSNRCDHKGCPWVWWGAASRCGTPVHRPHHPGIRTDGFQGLHAAGHTPYRHVPTTDPQSCCRLWSLLQPLADPVHFNFCVWKKISQSPSECGSISLAPQIPEVISYFITVFFWETKPARCTMGLFLLRPSSSTGNDKSTGQRQNGKKPQLLPLSEFPEGQKEFSQLESPRFTQKWLNLVKWSAARTRVNSQLMAENKARAWDENKNFEWTEQKYPLS